MTDEDEDVIDVYEMPESERVSTSSRSRIRTYTHRSLPQLHDPVEDVLDHILEVSLLYRSMGFAHIHFRRRTQRSKWLSHVMTISLTSSPRVTPLTAFALGFVADLFPEWPSDFPTALKSMQRAVAVDGDGGTCRNRLL